MCFVDSLDNHHIYEVCNSPTHKESSAIRHFKSDGVIEIHNGIIYDFYMGFSHILMMLGLKLGKNIISPIHAESI